MHKLPSATADFDSSVKTTCCFCAYLSRLAFFPHGRYGFLAATLPRRPLLARLLWKSSWVYLGPTGFCQIWADGTAGHLSILKGNKPNVSFLCCVHCVYDSQYCLFLCASSKAHLENPVCFEIFVWERPCWCSITTLCLVLVLLLAWHKTIFHNCTLVAEFGCCSPSFKHPTLLFCVSVNGVFQPKCDIDDH